MLLVRYLDLDILEGGAPRSNPKGTVLMDLESDPSASRCKSRCISFCGLGGQALKLVGAPLHFYKLV